MYDWFRQLVWRLYGLQDIDPKGEGDIAWVGLPAPWLFWLVLAAVGVGLWVVFRSYARERSGASPAVRRMLAGLRGALLLAALVFLLQPMWLAKQTPKEETGLVVVLLDDSLSMKTRDEYKPDDLARLAGISAKIRRIAEGREGDDKDGKDGTGEVGAVSRIRVLNELTAGDGFDLLGELEKRKHRLKVYGFGAGNREGVRELRITRAAVPGDDDALPLPTAGDPVGGDPTGDSPRAGKAARKGSAGGRAEEPTGPPRIEPLEGAASTTELGSAVQYVFERHRHEKLAGIVVVSDGRNVGGVRPADAARELARGDIGVPVFTVCVGLPDPPPEITIEGFEDFNPSYFIRNPIQVGVKVRAAGFADREVPLTLKFDTPVKAALVTLNERGVVTERTKVEPRAEIRATVKLVDGHKVFKLPAFEIHEAGRFSGVVAIPPQKGETWDGDNSEVIEFEVRPNIRTLLIGGAPGWEFRWLKDYFRRQPLLDVSTFLQNAPADHYHEASDPAKALREIPSDETKLAEYDLIVLIDPDPRVEMGLSPDWFKTVHKLVKRDGLGFLYVAGDKFAHHLLNDPNYEELFRLLPVQPDGLTQRSRDDHVNRFHTWALTDKGRRSPVVAQLPVIGGRVGEVFGALEGFWFHVPTATPKAGAVVLANPGGHDDSLDHVLWAEHSPGNGVSMWLAGDNTHRWRGRSEGLLREFWLQLARYLTSRRGVKAGERLRIDTDKKLYRARETVQITASGGPAAGGPGSGGPGSGEDAVVAVEVRRADGAQAVTLKRRPGPASARAEFQGFYVPPADGDYGIFVKGDAQPRRKFRVETAGPELADKRSDPAALRAMARAARTGRPASSSADPGWAGLTVAERSGRLVIEDLDKDGPAAAAGLKRGDVITSAAGRPAAGAADFEARLDAKAAGEVFSVAVERGGLAEPVVPLRLGAEPNFADLREAGRAGLTRLIDRVEPVKKKTPTRPKGRPLWSEWWIFVLFVSVISAEWAARKMYRMT